MLPPDVAFPNLGIEIQTLNRTAFTLPFFDLSIRWYGIFIGLGIVAGGLVAFRNTKRNGISNELFMDFCLIAVAISLLFTRLYSVVFNLEHYMGNWGRIFAFRDGGMGVYGGILAAFGTCYVFARVRKVKMGALGDTGVFGLVLGQIIGRIGNFFNQEAFGGFTNNIFAMQLRLRNISWRYGGMSLESLQALRPEEIVGNVNYEMLQNAYYVGTEVVVLVHPAFLYEMILNTGIFAFLWFYRDHKKFQGELLLIYAAAYSLGRFFIESLRMDQLFLWNTQIPASMFISAVIFPVAVGLLVYFRIKTKKPAAPSA